MGLFSYPAVHMGDFIHARTGEDVSRTAQRGAKNA